MTDKPTPTDAELEALLLDKLPASKHYIRPVIEKMVAAMQAAIDKWGQPAQAQADSVLEDAERLDFLIDQRAYVVSDPDACPGHWLHWARPDGSTWVQCDEHPTPRAAIDAAMNKGGAA